MARSKGQGSIYQRSNGLYVGTITKNGVKKQISSKDKRYVELKLYELSLLDDFSLEGSVLFQKYVYDYLYTYKYNHIKASSFDRLESIYRNHIYGTSLGKSRVEDIDDILVQQFINDKCIGVSLSQAKKIYELVRVVLFYAYRKGDIKKDIGSLVALPKASMFPEPKHIEVYTNYEVNHICGFIMDEYKTADYNLRRLLRISPALVVMFNTGLRAGELLALTWNDVDMLNRVIHVHSNLIRTRKPEGLGFESYITSVKTSASVRDVPINDKAFHALNELYKRYDDFDCHCDYVVCNLKYSFLTLQGLQENMKRVCELISLEYKGLHAIRHTFATRLIDLGTPPKVVSELLGHTSVAFTLNRYVHPDVNIKMDALKNL